MLLEFFSTRNLSRTSGGKFRQRTRSPSSRTMDVFFFFFQGERVRDSSNCRGCLARGGLQRVPSRASRVCIKEGAGTANGSQESSKGGLEFVSPLSDVCWTCRQQSAYSALSPRIFFLSSPHSSNPPIPLGVEWKLENGSSVSGIPDSKFHERERERESGRALAMTFHQR